MSPQTYAAGSATRLLTLVAGVGSPLLCTALYVIAPDPEKSGGSGIVVFGVVLGLIALAAHAKAHGFAVVIDDEGITWRGFRSWSVPWAELERAALVELRGQNNSAREVPLERLEHASVTGMRLDLYRAGKRHRLAGEDIENFAGVAQRVLMRTGDATEPVVSAAAAKAPGEARHSAARVLIAFPLVLGAFVLMAVIAVGGKELIGGIGGELVAALISGLFVVGFTGWAIKRSKGIETIETDDR